MNNRNKGQAAVSSALLLAGILGISMFTSGTTEQSSTPENDIEIHDLYEMEQTETGDDFAVAEEIEKSEIEELNTSESLLVLGDSFSSTAAPSNGAQDEIVPDPETSETNAAQHDDETASITADAVSSSITEAAAAVQVYYFVNENVPFADGFSPPYDASYNYSPLDELGRCGRAWAILSQEAMPTQPRGSIGMIRPSGWHLIRYDFIDGQYLYNRCHLIGYQLGGSNSPRNLITGTRFLNTSGMLPFENVVADYLRETDNRVLYRVTPNFEGDDLLCSGVQIEAYSIEDEGAGICFNVFVPNKQPGVIIDYATGENSLDEAYWALMNRAAEPSSEINQSETIVLSDNAPEPEAPTEIPMDRNIDTVDDKEITYILNKNTKKFHHPECNSAKQISPKNYLESYDTREEIIEQGYKPCGNCKP